MAGAPNSSIYYVLVIIMFFAFPFMQRLEFVSGTTILVYSNVSCLESEKKALLQFRQGLIDKSNILSSWVGDDDCCTWYGVGCSRVTGNVLKLNLSSPYGYNCYRDYCLKGNQIKGKIPENIGSLRQLFRLDLSRNKLSGPIPQSLSNLSFLNHLNLSFNDLSGIIPAGYQLQTLNDPSIYMGNKDLCGPPSLNRCPDNPESPDPNRGKESESDDDEDGDDHLWFYSGVGPGFAVGFLGFCGALHFNKSWRHAYFHFFEKVWNALGVAIVVKTARFRHKFGKHVTEG